VHPEKGEKGGKGATCESDQRLPWFHRQNSGKNQRSQRGVRNASEPPAHPGGNAPSSDQKGRKHARNIGHQCHPRNDPKPIQTDPLHILSLPLLPRQTALPWASKPHHTRPPIR